MQVHPTRRALTLVSLAVLAALSACGGDSDSPAFMATAQDDTATVPWNKPAAVPVTANDTIANGSASIAIATAPAHGTASVDGGTINYTPAAGYFGADSLTYTLTVGDKTSTATLHLAVTAQVTLTGTVHDDAMPGAQVVAMVGGVAQPAVTADADGHYSVTITASSPSDFITLQATGAGAQANVVLESLVGDASTTAAAASSDGTVDATALPAANVTNVSTAIAVLTAQAIGKTPTSGADVASAQGQFTSSQTIQMATAIKLVADAGVALPAGSANTLALVSDPATYGSFVTTQVTTNATLFGQTQDAVLADPSLAVAPPVPAAGAPDVAILLTLGQGASAQDATRLTLKADGTATIGGESPDTATWTTDGAQITVTYDTPQVYTNNDVDTDGIQYSVTETDTGFKLRQLGGTPGVGPATVDTIGSVKWLQGPHVGATSALADFWESETMVGVTGTIGAADVVPGTEWAGAITTDYNPSTSSWIDQDVLKIVDATHVQYERTQVSGTYAVTDGKLIVTTSNGTFSYTRLFNGPKGEERWLTERLDANGGSEWVFDAAVVKVSAGLAFTTASAAHDWKSYINAGLAGASQFYIDLDSNGTGVPVNINSDGSSGTPYSPGTWTIATDGSEVFTRSYCNDGTLSCNNGQVRSWTLLATSGANIYVMERLQNLPGLDQYRVNVYTNADH